MIEIKKYRAGICGAREEQPAEYSVRGAEGIPDRLCQGCLIDHARNVEVIRSVLLIQAATRE